MGLSLTSKSGRTRSPCAAKRLPLSLHYSVEQKRDHAPMWFALSTLGGLSEAVSILQRKDPLLVLIPRLLPTALVGQHVR